MLARSAARHCRAREHLGQMHAVAGMLEQQSLYILFRQRLVQAVRAKKYHVVLRRAEFDHARIDQKVAALADIAYERFLLAVGLDLLLRDVSGVALLLKQQAEVMVARDPLEPPVMQVVDSAVSRGYPICLAAADDYRNGRRAAAELSSALVGDRAVDIMNARREAPLTLQDGAAERISSACGGDVRKAINSVELLFSAAGERSVITAEDAAAITQRSAMRYDRDGDDHYDILSALMKSLRGSDPDAALHYLARLLEVGDLIGACRRILCSASEDIGLAYPLAVPIVKACVDSALQLGLPEAKLPLAEACLLLATAPKSNSACMGIDAALADVRAGRTGSIPRELQNVHADGAGFEREQGYKYPHSYPGHWVRQQYLPYELRGAHYYDYGDNKTEQAAKRYWEEIKK